MIDGDLKAWLKHNGFLELSVMGFLLNQNSDDSSILAQARGLLAAFGAPDPQDRWAGMIMFLFKVAIREAPLAAERTGSVSQLQVSFDRDALARENFELRKEQELITMWT